jgi:SulP family sulfate permease
MNREPKVTADLIAGITVAIVALPLALGFGITSGMSAAAIAGVLIGTSYRILNPVSIIESLRTTRSEVIVLVATAVATLFIDLIWGIAIGIVLHFVLQQAITKRTKLESRDET